jgi:hypothetical protein
MDSSQDQLSFVSHLSSDAPLHWLLDIPVHKTTNIIFPCVVDLCVLAPQLSTCRISKMSTDSGIFSYNSQLWILRQIIEQC